MLEKLGFEGERIFDTELVEDNNYLELQEACDGYYSTFLNKDQVIELANDLLKLSDQMK